MLYTVRKGSKEIQLSYQKLSIDFWNHNHFFKLSPKDHYMVKLLSCEPKQEKRRILDSKYSSKI